MDYSLHVPYPIWKDKTKNGIVEITFEVFNQNNELVLTDVTEMIV